jgi:hypothetical protein
VGAGRWCLVAGTLVAAAGCGAVPGPRPRPRARAAGKTRSGRDERCRARLRDVAGIERARTHAATSDATDRFVADLERSGVSLATENRLIDLAISASIDTLPDCFQALEAMRPIPSLAGHACR